MRLACLIVTHQSAEHIGPCLDAIANTGLFESGAVLVVDNASTDHTVQIARNKHSVKIFDSGKNSGFAAAVNQGFRTLEADYILLLNPDVEVVSGLDHLLEACERTGAAAGGGKLIGPDGQPQQGFQVRRFPSAVALAFEVLGLNQLFPGNSVNWRYRCLDHDPDAESLVEQPAGAFLLIRREAWQAIGGFDEQFFPLWFEDVDFLYRLNRARFCVIYSPTAVGKHSGGHSVASLRWETRQLYWYSNLLRFAAKHYSWKGRWLVSSAVLAGCFPRTLTRSIRQWSFRPLAVYGRIVTIAVICLFSAKVTDETGSSSVAQPSEEAGA